MNPLSSISAPSANVPSTQAEQTGGLVDTQLQPPGQACSFVQPQPLQIRGIVSLAWLGAETLAFEVPRRIREQIDLA